MPKMMEEIRFVNVKVCMFVIMAWIRYLILFPWNANHLNFKGFQVPIQARKSLCGWRVVTNVKLLAKAYIQQWSNEMSKRRLRRRSNLENHPQALRRGSNLQALPKKQRENHPKAFIILLYRTRPQIHPQEKTSGENYFRDTLSLVYFISSLS